MLRQRDRLVLLLGSNGVAAWRRASISSSWEPIVSCSRNNSRSDALTAAPRGTIGALEELVAQLDGVSRPEIQVVLASALCPGLVVRLGEEPLTRTVRERLALHRLQQAFGIAPPQWTVEMDARSVTGATLAFAVETELLARITRTLAHRSPRTLSIVPTVAWAVDLLDERFEGWIVIDGAEEATVARCAKSEVDVLENISRLASIHDAARHVAASGVRHGIVEPGVSLTLISPGGRLGPGVHQVGAHEVHVIDPFGDDQPTAATAPRALAA